MESWTFVFNWLVFLSCKNYSGGIEQKNKKELKNMDNSVMIVGAMMGGGRKACRGDRW